MDNPLVILLLIAAGIILAGIVLKVGFSIPARVTPPPLYDQQPAVDDLPIPPELPAAVQRSLRESFGERALAPQNVLAYGNGRFRIRRIGFLGYLWAPLAWTIELVPGESFQWRMNMTWFRRTIVEGGDGYQDGKGSFQMGRGKPIENENMDYSEQVMLWLYTLIFAPGSLLRLPGVSWQAVDDQTAQVQIEHAGRSLSFSLGFDPQTGQLTRIDTSRPSSGKGDLYPYTLLLEKGQSFNGMTLAAHLQAAWEGDFYVNYMLAGIQYNGPLEEIDESQGETEEPS